MAALAPWHKQSNTAPGLPTTDHFHSYGDIVSTSRLRSDSQASGPQSSENNIELLEISPITSGINGIDLTPGDPLWQNSTSQYIPSARTRFSSLPKRTYAARGTPSAACRTQRAPLTSSGDFPPKPLASVAISRRHTSGASREVFPKLRGLPGVRWSWPDSVRRGWWFRRGPSSDSAE